MNTCTNQIKVTYALNRDQYISPYTFKNSGLREHLLLETMILTYMLFTNQYNYLSILRPPTIYDHLYSCRPGSLTLQLPLYRKAYMHGQAIALNPITVSTN